MNERQIILFKLSYLTFLILNMAYMKDDLQEDFDFDQDLYDDKFTFMKSLDKNFFNFSIGDFIDHINDKN